MDNIHDFRKGQIQSSYELLEKGKAANIGEIRIWSGEKQQKQADGSWKHVGEEKDIEKKEEFEPKNKSVVKLKNAVDSETEYWRYPKAISIYTMDKLKEFDTMFKGLKKKESFKDLSKETKSEVEGLIKYNKDKMNDLRDRLKKEKDMENHLKQYGHSTAYIDNRRK